MIYQYSGSSYEIKNKFKKNFLEMEFIFFFYCKMVFSEFPQEENTRLEYVTIIISKNAYMHSW